MSIFDWLRGIFRSPRGDQVAPNVTAPQRDFAALTRVTERVMRNGNPEMRGVPLPLLTLEEFFDGNDFAGSIGCNLDSVPLPAEFYNWLTQVRDKPEVSDVRIQITCVDDPGRDWPFSDTIWVITSASASSVKEWVPEMLGPCETWEGWVERTKYDECIVADGHHPIAVWYD